jgi:adenylate kinase
MTSLLLIGPPGAGKGTQATLIAEKLAIPHISTGAIFRANVAEGTDLGLEAQSYMERGEYVPDSVTNAMVRNRLAVPDTGNGFLLDGYPRTLAQVDELDTILADLAKHLDAVVEITADVDELTQRLLARAAKEGRADDTEDVIRRRMQVYAEQTEPIVAVYTERGIVRKVDGMGSIEDVNERIVAALGG